MEEDGTKPAAGERQSHFPGRATQDDRLPREVRERLGVEILSLAVSGFRVFVTKRPVQTAADVQGIKLRVPEIPVYVEMARALGTNPTPIPAGEIYTALQTGVVDGMEAPADFVDQLAAGRGLARGLMESVARPRRTPADKKLVPTAQAQWPCGYAAEGSPPRRAPGSTPEARA